MRIDVLCPLCPILSTNSAEPFRPAGAEPSLPGTIEYDAAILAAYETIYTCGMMGAALL